MLLTPDGPDQWVRHPLEATTCDHFTCVAGDLYGDGRTHLVTGNFSYKPRQEPGDAVTIWKNLGP